MKALVLCGGFARRLGRLGKTTPKALLRAGGKPVLTHAVEKISQIREVDSIIISTNAKFESSFREWMHEQKSGEISLITEPSDSEEKKFGAVAAVSYAISSAGINDDMLLVMGDNLFSFRLDGFASEFARLKKPCHVVFDIGSLEKAKLYGAPVIKNSVISELVEKPQNPVSTLVSTGIYFFTKNSLALFPEYLRMSGKRDHFGDFMSWLVRKEEVRAFAAHGEWFDIGNTEVLRKAREWAVLKR